MGSFRFDYTRDMEHAEKQAEQEKPLQIAKPVIKQPVRQPVSRPVQKPEKIIIHGIDPGLASLSQDGRALRVKLLDDRSETGVGWLSVPAGKTARDKHGINIDLGTASHFSGIYGVVSGGKFTRLDDKPADIASRLSHAISSDMRRKQAEQVRESIGPGGGREEGDTSWHL